MLLDACFVWTARSTEGLKAFEGVPSRACAVSPSEGWLEFDFSGEVGHTSSFSPSDCAGDVKLSLGSWAPEFSFIISGRSPSYVTRAATWWLLAGGLWTCCRDMMPLRVDLPSRRPAARFPAELLGEAAPWTWT